MMLISFLTTFMLYVYHKVHWLHYLPEAVASILVGILIGMWFKIHY